LFLLKQIQTSRNEVANSGIKEKERGRERAGRAFHAINTGAAEIQTLLPKDGEFFERFYQKSLEPNKTKGAEQTSIFAGGTRPQSAQ